MTWRRRRPFFNSIWDEIFPDMHEINDIFETMVNEMQRDPNARTWYYGYQMTPGPDGKPVIREFGNIRPRGTPQKLGVREPLIDVSTDDKAGTVKVVAEMPGADKDSIKVNATEEHVRITADHGGKPYNADVPLNIKVNPESADASYTNGILQVVFKKKGPEPPKGFNVHIK